jgi:hypothetical protein
VVEQGPATVLRLRRFRPEIDGPLQTERKVADLLLGQLQTISDLGDAHQDGEVPMFALDIVPRTPGIEHWPTRGRALPLSVGEAGDGDGSEHGDQAPGPEQ